jgi:hypothetical protein
MPCGCGKQARFAPPAARTAAAKAKPSGGGPKVWTGSRPAAKQTPEK